ncbi:MAG: sporulation and cell division repeat protein [Rhodospirillales bacterium]|nr:sporulation and cell division repeat protein [Rhodospirillales bacterium]
MRAPLVLAGLALLFGCAKPGPTPTPHYVLGAPYRASGVWYYPAERTELVETGLATILPPNHAPLTTNGETYDPGAMAAAHPTLQLPAIARITDLETGRSVVVRINDRGTGDPRRLVQVTPRVATLLGMREGQPAQVRLELLGAESRAAVEGLAGAPSLPVAAAPRGTVQQADLPPPPGVREGRGRVASAAAMPSAADPTAAPAVAMRLTEQVTQGPVQPGRLWVRLDTFEEYQYAAIQRAKLIGLRPSIVSSRVGRTRQFRVQIGPLASVPEADAALDQALAAGIPDARIVVE